MDKRICRQASDELTRIAKELMATPEYTFDDVKRLVIAQGGLMKYIKAYGVEEELNNGYALHHFAGKEHEITRKKGTGAVNHYKRICQTLSGTITDPGYLRSLRNEIDHIALVPIWFHRYLHNKHPKIRERKDCYDLLVQLMTAEDTYNQLGPLRFNGASIKSSLQSIEKLLSIPAAYTGQMQKDIKDELSDTFICIKNSIIDYLRRLTQQ